MFNPNNNLKKKRAIKKNATRKKKTFIRIIPKLVLKYFVFQVDIYF